MKTVLVAVLLLRLIPYGVAAYFAFHRGYKWLGHFAIFCIFAVLVSTIFTPPAEVRGLIGSVASLLLMFHALDLSVRARGGKSK